MSDIFACYPSVTGAHYGRFAIPKVRQRSLDYIHTFRAILMSVYSGMSTRLKTYKPQTQLASLHTVDFCAEIEGK
jgi:hypothetical protein